MLFQWEIVRQNGLPEVTVYRLKKAQTIKRWSYLGQITCNQAAAK